MILPYGKNIDNLNDANRVVRRSVLPAGLNRTVKYEISSCSCARELKGGPNTETWEQGQGGGTVVM
jgi:hypothetical protein